MADEEAMSSSSSKRQPFEQKLAEAAYMAKVAEQAERYDDMTEYMSDFVLNANEIGYELSLEERNLLSVAYKNAVGARRAAWRIVLSIEQKESESAEKVSLTRDYRGKIEAELDKICGHILDLLDKSLIPSAVSPESKVFYLKMKGDYHRYRAELKSSEPRKEAADNTMDAYNAANEIAVAELTSIHPIRLGLALNISVFYYEILNNVDKACQTAKQAFDEALAALETLGEESYKDTTLIMQVLRDNLTLWTSEVQDKTDEA